MKTILFNCIVIALLFINTIVLLRTLPIQGSPIAREKATETTIVAMRRHLELYRQFHGYYPQRLEDIPDLKRSAFYDAWNVLLQYIYYDERGEYVLRSIGHDESLAQRKNRLLFHIVATGYMAVLIFLVLIIRFRKDGCFPVKQGLPLIFLFIVGFILQLGDNWTLISPTGKFFYFQFPLLFFLLIVTAGLLPVFALVLAITRRDFLYFAALAIAPYTALSVLSLVT